jgi:hypothetical protein
MPCLPPVLWQFNAVGLIQVIWIKLHLLGFSEMGAAFQNGSLERRVGKDESMTLLEFVRAFGLDVPLQNAN